MAFKGVKGRARNRATQAYFNVGVEVIRRSKWSSGQPFVATACIRTPGKKGYFSPKQYGRACGRSVAARSAESAVAKALKALSHAVAYRRKSRTPGFKTNLR